MQVYINNLVYNTGNPDIYRFFEPQSLQKFGNKKMDCQTYIQRWIQKSRKRIYFAPIIHVYVTLLYIFMLSNLENMTNGLTILEPIGN